MLVRLARSPSCGIRGVEIGEQCQMTPTRVSRLLDRLVFETLTLEERATLMGLLARLRDRAQELLNER